MKHKSYFYTRGITMKKYIRLMQLTTTVSLMGLAVNYTNAASKIELPITCPKEIQCSKDKSLSSCKAAGDNLEYWGEINSSAPIEKGIHYFHTAIAYYQSPHDYGDLPICQYPQIYSGIVKGYLSIRAKKNFNLEAFKSIPTNWRIGGYRADCENGIVEPIPKDQNLCSFAKVPMASIALNVKKYIALTAYANGVSVIEHPVHPGQTGKINLYQVWDGCGDRGECTINFVANIDGVSSDLGGIVVDMDNKMKISRINSAPLYSGYAIVKIENENNVEIRENPFFFLHFKK